MLLAIGASSGSIAGPGAVPGRPELLENGLNGPPEWVPRDDRGSDRAHHQHGAWKARDAALALGRGACVEKARAVDLASD
jgi:hypothetical protein